MDEGIMNYIHKRFVVFSEVKSNPEHLGLLKNYLIELSTIPEIKGKHDKGLRYILEKFVIGMGKEFSKNLSKELMKDDFLAWCWSYSLAKGGEDYDVFASDILRKKLKERGCLIVKTHFYPLKMPKEIGKNNLEIISG